MPKAKVTRDMVIEAAFAVARTAGAEQVNARTVHSDYLMETEDLPLGIGLNYIRFAIEEPHLFRFLFQSGFAMEGSLPEMLDSAELTPILAAMQGALGMSAAQTKRIFTTVALFTHGYASLLANNGLDYDEAAAAEQLERVWRGAVLCEKEGSI